MGVPFSAASERLPAATEALFADPTVRSVGVGLHDEGYGFFVVRNSAAIVPFSAPVLETDTMMNVPLIVRNTPAEIEHLSRVPDAGDGSPLIDSTIVERTNIRPLCSGLQIQNFDDDVRSGEIAKGFIIIGTLGCFVRLSNGDVALLSNNHVVAAENHGVKAKDRILQPGAFSFTTSDHVATLNDFAVIQPSPAGATVAAGTAILNRIDAGIAVLEPSVSFRQGYHASRKLLTPNAVAKPRAGDDVFKVGRTTGLTRGTIKSVATVVGPVPYRDGPSWFSRSITIEGVNGTMFSDHGDSGSTIVNTTGEIVGLLYAGNGTQTYACPIEDVFTAFTCTLA